RVVIAIAPAAHDDEPAQESRPRRAPPGTVIGSPEPQSIAAVDSFDFRGIQKLPEVLRQPEARHEPMALETVKVDHEYPVRPGRHATSIGTGDEKMAQI